MRPDSPPPAVLLRGSGGAEASEFAFLEPMLARERSVHVLGVDELTNLRDIVGLGPEHPGVLLVAVGGDAREAIRAIETTTSGIGRLVLIDPPVAAIAAVDSASTRVPVLVIDSRAGLNDVRETLQERPARILSLIEAFAAPDDPAPRIRPRPDTETETKTKTGGRALPEISGVTDVDTVIVGAGFAGLGMGIRLARRGERSFVILERAADVGGTWRDNVYPGVACDIPSHLYSFSFLPKPNWSSFFAEGREIHEYLREAARSEGLHERLRLNSEVLEMRWNEAEERWRVSTGHSEYRCRTLVVAAGRLSDARMPAIPGLQDFTGTVMHSSAWDDSVDLLGKRVGVVGTGASAAQLIPRVAKETASLVVFQRSAPYVVPRPDRNYSAEEMLGFELDPSSREAQRDDLFWAAETAFAERMRVPGYIDRLRERALGHLDSQLNDPALRAAATPDYEIGCKRVVISNDYYPALASPAVTLEPSALRSVDGSIATSADGSRFDLDVLVFATGFESTRPPFAARTFGTGGIRLADEWNAGMSAHASTTVHGFPNLFVLDGPNASLGHNSAVVMIEAQIDYVLGALDHRATAGVDVLEVTREAQDAYSRELDERAASSVWLTGGCDSWYVDERSGRLTLLWPDFAYAFQRRLGRFDFWNYYGSIASP